MSESDSNSQIALVMLVEMAGFCYSFGNEMQ